MYLTTGEPVIKGAPVTTEARAIPGASATIEVQNNSAEVQYDSASDSDPVRGDWGLKGPSAQKILILIEIVNQLGFYESHICPLSKAIWKP